MVDFHRASHIHIMYIHMYLGSGQITHAHFATLEYIK